MTGDGWESYQSSGRSVNTVEELTLGLWPARWPSRRSEEEDRLVKSGDMDMKKAAPVGARINIKSPGVGLGFFTIFNFPR